MKRATRAKRKVIVVDDPKARRAQSLAKAEGLLRHAILSFHYWLRRVRLPRDVDTYGGAYALDGAGVWRRRAGELLRTIRRLRSQS